MIEDESFNAFLKARMEEGVKVPKLRMAPEEAEAHSRSMRQVWWWSAVKVAAALAVLCGILVWRAVQLRDSRQELQIAQAIELLEECQPFVDDNGESAALDSSSMAEKLLAWQDAPFAEVVNSRGRGEELSAESAGEGKAPHPAGA